MSTELSNWISAQRGKIIEADDQVMFDEVSKCLLAGCYRAAYILGWVMIAESLKRKIYKLSGLGDATAVEINKKIETQEGNKQSVDKLIVENVGKCGIVEPNEVSTIEYLWAQRCVFAHPYNLSPVEGEVRHLLEQSIMITLSRNLTLNKAYLQELSKNLAEKPYFLPAEKEAVFLHAHSILSRTPQRLYPFFFKTLLSDLGGIINEDTKNRETAKLRWYIIALTEKAELPLDDESWTLVEKAGKYPFESFAGYASDKNWGIIPDRVKDMLIGYFAYETDNRKLTFLKLIVRGLLSTGVLEDRFRIKLVNKLDSIPFDGAIDYYGIADLQFNRIVTELNSGSFELQNIVADYIKTTKAIQFINSLEPEKQIQLGILIAMAANERSFKCQNLIAPINSGYYPVSDYVRLGIALYPFESNKSSPILRENFLLEFAQAINQLIHEVQKLAYVRIELTFINKPPDEHELKFYQKNELKQKIDAFVGDIQWSEGHRALFDALVSKIVQHYTRSKVAEMPVIKPHSMPVVPPSIQNSAEQKDDLSVNQDDE
jgi:hypothetical protein